MELRNRLRVTLTSEQALIIEALVSILLMNCWLGFEPTVLVTLSVLAGHIFKMSYKET